MKYSRYLLYNYNMSKNQVSFYNQAGRWWGGSDITDEYRERAKKVEQLLGSRPLDILDLGAGNGGTSAAMAELGHNVIGIEYAEERANQAKVIAQNVKNGQLSIICDDFYTYTFDRKFDLVTYWDGFGIGTDAEQQSLLRRIPQEWLKEDGVLLMDVYSPYGPISESGTQEELSKLQGVAESVDMIRKVHFDFVRSRWIDEWQPKDNPKASMSQDLRCYTPEDFKLLITDTNLKIVQIEIKDEIVPKDLPVSETSKLFKDSWSYFVQLARSTADSQ